MFRGRPHRPSFLGPILAIAFACAANGAAAPLRPLSGQAGQADTQPPSVPQGMAFAGKTQKTVSLVWRRSSDDVKVVGYRLFQNNVRVAVVTGTSYIYRRLACAKRYRFALEAVDAAGNVSNRAEATGWITTSTCTASVAPPEAKAKPKPRPKPKPKPKPAPAPKGPPDGTANLWVDANGGSCGRQATPGAYADVRACSWNQAYQAAQTGDFVAIRGGDYGNVRIGPNKASIGSPGVTFRPAKGEQVIVRDFENGINGGADGGNNIRLLGPVAARTFRSDGTSNILVSGWRVDCGGCDGEQIFHLEDAQRSTVRDSNIGNNKNNSLIWISGSGITFDHNVIHDAGLPDGSSAHTECMFAWRVTNLTLRRNHFYHCSVMDVFITGGDVSTGGLVENNVFEKPWENTGRISNGHAFHFRNGGSPSPDPSGWEFRYNTFVGGLSISPDENPVGPGGLKVTGNLFLSTNPCGQRNATYSYNAFAGGGCGSNNVVASTAAFLSGFASKGDPGTYALLTTSVLRDKGNPGNFPTVDRNGNKRPVGGVPDIGALEFR
jgi:hypothetical protein